MSYNKKTGQYLLTFTLDKDLHDSFKVMNISNISSLMRDLLTKEIKDYKLRQEIIRIRIEDHELRKQNEHIELFNMRILAEIGQDQYDKYIHDINHVDNIKQD